MRNKSAYLEETRILADMGFKFYATGGTAKFMRDNNIAVDVLHWPLDKKEPNAVTYLADGRIDLVINIPKNTERSELTNGYLIRRQAIDHNIPLITNLQLAKRFVKSIQTKKMDHLKIKSWEEYQS
jgi:carbamoyl-phosphate synthase large subunit